MVIDTPVVSFKLWKYALSSCADGEWTEGCFLSVGLLGTLAVAID